MQRREQRMLEGWGKWSKLMQSRVLPGKKCGTADKQETKAYADAGTWTAAKEAKENLKKQKKIKQTKRELPLIPFFSQRRKRENIQTNKELPVITCLFLLFFFSFFFPSPSCGIPKRRRARRWKRRRQRKGLAWRRANLFSTSSARILPRRW